MTTLNWELQTTPVLDLAYLAIAYGGNTFVAVGEESLDVGAMASTDKGASWALGESEDRVWNGVAFGNLMSFDMFISVSENGPDDGRAAYSLNGGINWSISLTPGDCIWRAITYGDGKFVSVASDGATTRVMYTLNPVSWALPGGTVPVGEWYGVTHGNGRFVAVGAGATITATDPDLDWTKSIVPTLLLDVAFGNDKFVAVSSSGEIVVSADGENWEFKYAAPFGCRSITFGNGVFVVVGTNGKTMIGADGENWTIVDAPDTRTYLGVAFGEDTFVAVCPHGTGNRAMTAHCEEIPVINRERIGPVLDNRFEGDPRLFLRENGSFLNFPGGQPEMDQSVWNFALIGLHTRKGWPGNALFRNEGSKIGSDYEAKTEVNLSLQALNDMQSAAERAVAPVIDTGMVDTIIVETTNPNQHNLQTTVEFYKNGEAVLKFVDLKNGKNWIVQEYT